MQRNKVKYAWIKANEAAFSVQAMCNALNVARSAYYKWHASQDQELSALVETEFKRWA